MLTLIAAAVMAAASPPESPPSTGKLILIYTTSAALDLAATELALAQPGTYEVNPWGKRRRNRLLLKGGQVAGQVVIGRLARNHPRWERVLRWTGVAVEVGLTGWNVVQYYRAKAGRMR